MMPVFVLILLVLSSVSSSAVTADNNERESGTAVKLPNKRSVEQADRVRFCGTVDRDLNNRNQGQTIYYDRIITNVGNGYNNSTGIFTVPKEGLYAIKLELNTKKRMHLTEIYVFLNGVKKYKTIPSDIYTYFQIEQKDRHYMLRLNKGDRIRIASNNYTIEKSPGLSTIKLCVKYLTD